MHRIAIAILLTLSLAACDNYVPRPKVATYDPVSGEVKLPSPCPDWSQSQTPNFYNAPHSNTGCAVNNNMAVQLAYPQDLMEGQGTSGPDNEITTRVIERYRAGEIPAALNPIQSGGASQ